MVEETEEVVSGEVSLSESERVALLTRENDGEEPDEDVTLDEVADNLTGYQMNSEREEAWIAAINPPENPDNPGAEIEVEFLLPSGDAFTETYSYPNRRWPEDHPFRKLIESTGYSPAALEHVIEEPVDITYNERREQWMTEIRDEYGTTPSTDTNDEQPNSVAADIFRLTTYVLGGFFVLILGIGFIIATRGAGLILIVVAALMGVLIFKILEST